MNVRVDQSGAKVLTRSDTTSPYEAASSVKFQSVLFDLRGFPDGTDSGIMTDKGVKNPKILLIHTFTFPCSTMSALSRAYCSRDRLRCALVRDSGMIHQTMSA